MADETTPQIATGRHAMPQGSDWRARAALLLGAGLLGLGLAQAGLLESATSLVPRCPLYTTTGLYCPGCGGTRALGRLLHFDLPSALHDNPLLVVAAPLLAYYFVLGPRPGSTPWPRWQVATLIVVILLFTVLRNLPDYPFNLLAPPQ